MTLDRVLAPNERRRLSLCRQYRREVVLRRRLCRRRLSLPRNLRRRLERSKLCQTWQLRLGPHPLLPKFLDPERRRVVGRFKESFSDENFETRRRKIKSCRVVFRRRF